MKAKKPRIKEEDLVKRYQDLLEIARLAKDPALAQDAEIVHQEIKLLESHLERFGKHREI
jgi:hypothetical protein